MRSQNTVKPLCLHCGGPLPSYMARPEHEVEAGGQFYHDRICPRCRPPIPSFEETEKLRAWMLSMPRPKYSWFNDKAAYYREKEIWILYRRPLMWQSARHRNFCGCGAKKIKNTNWCVDCRDSHQRRSIQDMLEKVKLFPNFYPETINYLKKVVDLWPVGEEFKSIVEGL